ncbi:hypothetical protein [Methylosinus sp. Sm6]|uniref:hypothetical protein n=1 Tax=Methylosinus sp. Sm6 TaxID=2866948 RepID=UPI001C9957C2|nr:hypothetical protein [Methylosinus sp. Sm6]MBY6242376.1 hypothetical protein [Methylosinus sp. Sm6]
MTSQALFNQFGYVDHLKRGGFSDEQARASAAALAGALRETVAAKHDVDRVETKIQALEQKIVSLEHKLVAEIHATVYKTFGALAALIGLISGVAAVAARFWAH